MISMLFMMFVMFMMFMMFMLFMLFMLSMMLIVNDVYVVYYVFEVYFFGRAHDGDGDGFLDGLELYKSIHHAIQHNAELPVDNVDDAFKTGQEDQAAIGELI